jgi:hypothetical protein
MAIFVLFLSFLSPFLSPLQANAAPQSGLASGFEWMTSQDAYLGDMTNLIAENIEDVQEVTQPMIERQIANALRQRRLPAAQEAAIRGRAKSVVKGLFSAVDPLMTLVNAKGKIDDTIGSISDNLDYAADALEGRFDRMRDGTRAAVITTGTGVGLVAGYKIGKSVVTILGGSARARLITGLVMAFVGAASGNAYAADQWNKKEIDAKFDRLSARVQYLLGQLRGANENAGAVLQKIPEMTEKLMNRMALMEARLMDKIDGVQRGDTVNNTENKENNVSLNNDLSLNNENLLKAYADVSGELWVGVPDFSPDLSLEQNNDLTQNNRFSGRFSNNSGRGKDRGAGDAGTGDNTTLQEQVTIENNNVFNSMTNNVNVENNKINETQIIENNVTNNNNHYDGDTTNNVTNNVTNTVHNTVQGGSIRMPHKQAIVMHVVVERENSRGKPWDRGNERSKAPDLAFCVAPVNGGQQYCTKDMAQKKPYAKDSYEAYWPFYAENGREFDISVYDLDLRRNDLIGSGRCTVNFNRQERPGQNNDNGLCVIGEAAVRFLEIEPQ